MNQYCGYIALVGRPNVGKSTLINRLLGQKLCITSKKPQTTRHRVIGIHTEDNCQFIYVDTPGIHSKQENAMNRVMNKTALQTLRDVDVIAFVVEALRFKEDDEAVLSLISKLEIPCILVVNKIDKVADKSLLLPWMADVASRFDFKAVVPISAQKGTQLDAFNQEVKSLLPEGDFIYDEDMLTDKPVRFLCAELLREKIFRFCGDELPYSAGVEIESFKEEDGLVRIHALILVDKAGHKRIIIGEKGQKLKEMATQARIDMEKLLDTKVFLKCWCKVKSGWSDDARILKQLGHEF